MRSHGKCLGIGGILFDHELQTEIVRLGARYLTAGTMCSTRCAAHAPMSSGMKTITVPRR